MGISSYRENKVMNFIRRFAKPHKIQLVEKDILQVIRSFNHNDISLISFSETIRSIKVATEHSDSPDRICRMIKDFTTKFHKSCQSCFADEAEIGKLQELDRLADQLQKYCH